MTTTIRQVLLDIEGTTCPVRFVSETLFPYAADRLEAFLEARQGDGQVRELLDQVAQAWREDATPAARDLLHSAPPNADASTRILPYLQWLIREDRKVTPLKELQGLIWEEGYACGALQGPLFPDVAPALQRWRDAGLGLAVYSSGSVKAQQLIYGHSNAGDLRPLFQQWFDTKIGSKLEPDSYIKISDQLNVPPQDVLFISDSLAELQAASSGGLCVLFCDRNPAGSGTPHNGGFQTVHDFDHLNPLDFCPLQLP